MGSENDGVQGHWSSNNVCVSGGKELSRVRIPEMCLKIHGVFES